MKRRAGRWLARRLRFVATRVPSERPQVVRAARYLPERSLDAPRSPRVDPTRLRWVPVWMPTPRAARWGRAALRARTMLRLGATGARAPTWPATQSMTHSVRRRNESLVQRALTTIATAPRQGYALAYERLLYPAWQRALHGRPIAAHLAELEASQWQPEEVVREKQLARLRNILAHAGRNVPYYRELFAKIGFDPRGVRSIDDLTAIPPLGRDVLRDRGADLIDPAYAGKNIRKTTSGTTGLMLRFEYCETSEAWRQAARLRAYGWAGYRMGLPALHYWGGHATSSPKVRLDRALRREVVVPCSVADEASFASLRETIARVRPHVVIGYTRPLALFSRWVHERGLREWDDIPIICGAEAVLPDDRAAIARTFGSHVFDTYGARETMLIAAECDRHHGLHLTEENLVVEITRNGAPVAPGESGEILVTDLHNRGMPLIRYRNGDLATMAQGPCSCGRSLRRLARVDGRSSEVLRDGRGRAIPGVYFIAILIAEDPDRLRQYRVVQRPSGEVRLEIVKGPAWSDEAFEHTKAKLREVLCGLPLTTTFVSAIPAGPNGKRRHVVVEKAQPAIVEKTQPALTVSL